MECYVKPNTPKCDIIGWYDLRKKRGIYVSKSFTVLIEQDPESGWLVGEVVELPGCYTQAPDLPQLQENINEAIAVYTSSM